MELKYTCERKSEKDALELAMRPYRLQIRSLFLYGVSVLLTAAAYGVAYCLCHSSIEGVCLFLVGGGTSLAIGVKFYLVIRHRVLDAYRSRKTNITEYRLTDDALFCAYDNCNATMPWSEFKKYRIDDDALYLQSRMGAFACVPDWSGRGVEKEELAAVLESAGLKRAGASGARKVLSAGLLIAVCVLLAAIAIGKLYCAVQSFKWKIVDVELKRQLVELISGNQKEIDNPYSCYWQNHGNCLQRLFVEAYAFKPERCYYLFDKDDDEADEIGIIAYEGGKAWRFCLPRGCDGCFERSEWFEEYVDMLLGKGVLYRESERDKWLEKVRPLAQKLFNQLGTDHAEPL